MTEIQKTRTKHEVEESLEENKVIREALKDQSGPGR
jgi:hypothetical protein